jgi:protein-disulfide isomerase
MASRTKQKEEARARRLAEEQARAARARRDRRLRMVGGVVLAALAIAAVLIVISSGSGSSTSTKANPKITQQVDALLNGIPQNGSVLGNPNAPVTMTYYGDLECPTCQAFTLGIDNGGLPELIKNEVRDGKVKIDYRSFETATRDPSVFKNQQVAALAAGRQKKFWNYAETFYHRQGVEGSSYVTESFLQSIAKQVTGLSLPAWESARNDQALTAQVVADVAAGNAKGVNGTPTLIFTGPKSQSVAPQAIPTYSDLQQQIAKVS